MENKEEIVQNTIDFLENIRPELSEASLKRCLQIEDSLFSILSLLQGQEENKQPNSGGWVKVSEKKPEIIKDYVTYKSSAEILCAFDDGHYEVCKYQVGVSKENLWDGWYSALMDDGTETPILWQPLPPLPLI